MTVTSDDPGLVFIREVCGVNEERARELFEAGGSAERGIDIFFSSQDESAPAVSIFHDVPPANKKIKSNHSNESQSLSSDKDSLTAVVVVTDPTSRLNYLLLATCFEEMTGTTKRLAKLDSLKKILTQIIHEVGGIGGTEESRTNDGVILAQTMDLILGSHLKLQVSWSAVSKAVMSVTGASSTQLRQAYQVSGDSGDAAASFMRRQRLLVQPKSLTIQGVYLTLEEISKCEGQGSQTQRHALMVKLLQSCKAEEIKFLVRTLLGNMRLGASLKTVLVGLAMAIEDVCDDHTGNISKNIQDTFDICPRLDKICLALLVGGIPRMLATCVLEVGTCINPMLANPAHSLQQVEKFILEGGSAVAEWKLDGVRCQAHWNGSEMKLYSRHMLENTEQFPDAVKSILEAKQKNITSFIIDAEIVGVEMDDEKNMRLLPFQDLSTRRKIAKDANAVNISIFVFDLMYLNSKSLLKTPLYERQQLLRDHFSKTQGFDFAPSIALDTYDETRVQEYLHEAVQGGAEGLMIKLAGILGTTGRPSAFSCHYESGVRSHTWLKVKRDYVAGVADTIDVVPIGAWHGTGRKAQRNFLSPVLLAVYDDREDVYKSICRCMTFTDAMYEATREFYFRGIPYPTTVGSETLDKGESNTVDSDEDESAPTQGTDSSHDSAYFHDDDRVNCYPSKPSALIVTNESPPFWFNPLEVWEVSFADLSLSKQHTAAQGLVDPTRGVALRFPRFKRRRSDKRVDQATTCHQIAELFAKQAKISSGTKVK